MRKRVLPFLLRRRRRIASGDQGQGQGQGQDEWLLPAAAASQSLPTQFLQRILDEPLLDIAAAPPSLPGLHVVREPDDHNTDSPAIVGEVIQFSGDRSMGFLLANLDAVSAAGSASLRLRPSDGGGEDEADFSDSVQIFYPSWFAI